MKRNTLWIIIVLSVSFVLFQSCSPGVSQTIENTAKDAAVAGAISFLTIDYSKSEQEWLNAVCNIATDSGCKYAEEYSTRMDWRIIREYKISTSYEVLSAEPYYVLQEGREIWQIKGISHQKGKEDLNDTTLVLVVKDGNRWKFERFVFDQEKEQIDQAKSNK